MGDNSVIPDSAHEQNGTLFPKSEIFTARIASTHDILDTSPTFCIDLCFINNQTDKLCIQRK